MYDKKSVHLFSFIGLATYYAWGSCHLFHFVCIYNNCEAVKLHYMQFGQCLNVVNEGGGSG